MSQHYHFRQRFKERFSSHPIWLSLAVIVLVLLVAASVYIWQSSRSGGSGPITIKPPTEGYYAGSPKHVITSDRFSFTSTSDWHYSVEQSNSPNSYVYFTQTKALIEYELDIYFDRSLDNQPVNYVLPVSVVGNQLKASELSSRCGNPLTNQTSPPAYQAMKFQDANYICAVKSSGERAAAALVGGNYDIPLTTGRGQSVTLSFAFTNNSSAYFGQQFKDVINSFKLK